MPKKISTMKNGDNSSIIKQPSKFIDKTTIRLRSDKEPEPVFEQFEFFTKQRPYPWTYFNFLRRIEYKKTYDFPNFSFEFSLYDLFDVPESKAVVLNHLSVGVVPIPGGGVTGSTVCSIAPEQVTGGMIGNVFWTLTTSTNSLFEVSARNRFTPGPAAGGREFSGFSEFNTNVLINGQSSTTVYLEPSSTVRWGLLSFNDASSFFLPADRDTGALGNKIQLVLLLKGHSLNRSDYDKLLEFQKLGY